jgi:hypothetical protein
MNFRRIKQGGYVKRTLNAGNTLNYSISGKKFREKISILADFNMKNTFILTVLLYYYDR